MSFLDKSQIKILENKKEKMEKTAMDTWKTSNRLNNSLISIKARALSLINKNLQRKRGNQLNQ